jgi:hypothetical protein
MIKRITFRGVLIGFIIISIPVYANKNSLNDLHPNILAKKNSSCKYIEICGKLVKMDCNSALDGPVYYFNNKHGEILMICGGACMIPKPGEPLSCKECPLQAWQPCKMNRQ